MEGGLFQHYVPQWVGSNGWVDCDLSDAENYNRFHGHNYSSTIKAVLNSDPSTIKTFNTLNYEGSQAYIIKPLSATPTSTDGGITIHNVEAWKNNGDISGWKCTEIKTDLDAGSVVEFIKKEGKWFNYIKGKTVNMNDTPDTSRFSVQGIGIASSIISVTEGNGGGGNGNGGGSGNGGGNGNGGGTY